MLSASSFQFINELKANNHREWFQANRTSYDLAKSDVEQFIAKVLDNLSKIDITLKGISAKETMFRINKDVRFSKDKSPYKTNFGAGISKEGRKLPCAGYYVHLEPGKSFVAGGIYMPEPEHLKIIREEIAFDSSEIKALLNNPDFKKFFAAGFDKMEKLANPPKGFDKNHPEVELLKLKSFIVSHSIQDKAFFEKNAAQNVALTLAKITPLVNYLNRILGK
jgi:uncharacterized protein (TIGR02453 family)